MLPRTHRWDAETRTLHYDAREDEPAHRPLHVPFLARFAAQRRVYRMGRSGRFTYAD